MTSSCQVHFQCIDFEAKESTISQNAQSETAKAEGFRKACSHVLQFILIVGGSSSCNSSYLRGSSRLEKDAQEGMAGILKHYCSISHKWARNGGGLAARGELGRRVRDHWYLPVSCTREPKDSDCMLCRPERRGTRRGFRGMGCGRETVFL